MPHQAEHAGDETRIMRLRVRGERGCWGPPRVLASSLAALVLVSVAPAETNATSAEQSASTSAGPIGRTQRSSLERALQAARDGDLEEAAAGTERIVAWFRAFEAAKPGAPLLSFDDASERSDWLAWGGGRVVRWADASLGGALLLRAWIEVERERPDRALPWLERARRRAPLRAEVLAELGFVEARLQRPGRALRDYERALELARHYSASRDQEGRALRGIGDSLVQMGAFRRGYDAYRSALRLQSDDARARREIAYLEALRRSDRLYRPASAREARALESARRDLTPRDIRTAPQGSSTPQVAWAGVVRGVQVHPASVAGGTGPRLLLDVEHRYFGWLERDAAGARLTLSPEGEGRFKVPVALEGGADLDAALAGFEVGSMLIAIGRPVLVSKPARDPELQLQLDALNLIDRAAWQVSRVPSRYARALATPDPEAQTLAR